MPHILVSISSHGFGHVAQTAPVINALRRRIPQLKVTLQTAVPHHHLSSRFESPFELIASMPDVGMVMHDALDVDRAATTQAYRDFHQDWQQKVTAQAAQYKTLAVNLVLADVPYLPLAAAAAAGIPAVALCSLDWATLYRHFCADDDNATLLYQQIHDAYKTVKLWLSPAPSMPIDFLEQTLSIGPIARIGKDRRTEIQRRCGLGDDEKLILVSLGGIDTRLAIETFPQLEKVRWLIPSAWNSQRNDTLTIEELEIDFVDLLRSADALITKPGYGSFVEAACNGTPILYIPRDDWPEQAYLVEWMEQHGRCLAIDRQQLAQGKITEPLMTLLATERREAVEPTGIQQAVDCLAEMLETKSKNPGSPLSRGLC